MLLVVGIVMGYNAYEMRSLKRRQQEERRERRAAKKAGKAARRTAREARMLGITSLTSTSASTPAMTESITRVYGMPEARSSSEGLLFDADDAELGLELDDRRHGEYLELRLLQVPYFQ
jgi:hypothetical protein